MTLSILAWGFVPYFAIGVFIVGHIWRYRRDRFGWTDEWMQLFRPRKARWGIVLFHVGTLAVVGGHIVGILVPASATSAIGISEATYRFIAVALGGLFGMCVVVGLGGLVWRRTMLPTIVANTRWIDRVTLLLISLVVALGMGETLGVNLIDGRFDYRSTVAVWFRSVLILSPQVASMKGVPLIYQIHALAAWAVLMVWPFSRLVHVWYAPFYLGKKLMAWRRLKPGQATA